MRFMKNSRFKKWICVLISCIMALFIVINSFALPTLSISNEKYILLEYVEFPSPSPFTATPYSDAVPSTEIDDNAVKLEFGDNVDSIILSYLVGDNWVRITDENSSNLPANANYQFEIKYKNISVEDLLAANGQMVYEGLPNWFKPTGTGALLYQDEIVAMIEAIDGKILISFNKEWLEEQKTNGVEQLGGYFKVSGTVDWHELPPDGDDVTLPDLNLTIHFEGDLAQKYGLVDIVKSEPELIKNENGKYYLKYELTVTSLENVPVPGVMVKDLFSNASYIIGYVGITDGLDIDAYKPSESSSADPFTEGTLSINGDYMIWNIGELGPTEVRTLTYYAEIAENYIDLVINNPIQNKAVVFTKNDNTGEEYQKDIDSNYFTPHNDVIINKDSTLVSVDKNGNGYISYIVTISAPETNSFDLENLTLSDMFPDALNNYLSGDDGGLITVTVTSGEEFVTKKVSYSNASFEITDLNLKPGDEITVTYKIKVTNIFFYNNGDAELTNTATISKGGRTLSGATNTETLEKHTWARKMVGNPIDKNIVIEIPSSDNVYEYENNQIVHDNTPPDSFTVPKGSLKYQIVVNENGQWDLSSTSMRDKFDSDYMKYAGYVQIQLYERDGKSSGVLTDSDVIAEFENSKPAKTVWLKVDDKGEFVFKPEDLGIDDNYAYLLTYYATPTNMDNVGSVEIINGFDIQGTIGDGKGGYMDFPGIEVSVGKVVQGGLHYNAEKISWYYEPSPVYKTAEVGGRYSESEFKDDYTNGAIYWIIRLEGDIGTGTVTGSGDSTSLSDFYIKDEPDDQTRFKRDSVVGVYIGSKNLNISAYESMETFVSEAPWDKQLYGNPLNDQWFGDPNITNPDYQWFASNTTLNGIIFPNGCKLNDDQAVYIVIRTIPTDNARPPADNNKIKVYHNTLSIASGGAKPVKVNTADYIYSSKTSLFKESKGAYTFDGETFINCSDKSNSSWIISDNMDTSQLTPGTYAAWLLNINWNGSMEGTADVIDYLPPGMELVYVDVNNFGNSFKQNPTNFPYTDYINELSQNGEWEEMITECSVLNHPGTVTTISYYNKTTGEIRWRIQNLTASGKFNQHEINLLIICRVVDPEFFLNGGGKTYVNTAAVLDKETLEPVDMESASVTLTRKISKYLDEELLNDLGGSMNGNTVNGTLNRIPFKIEINSLGENMTDGDTLPALIDEFSEFLMLIEDTINVTAGGVPYTNFTYTVEEKNGHQTLIIYGLPDGVPITLTYQARIDSVPNQAVEISNIAYWAGHTPPDKPQVGDSTFEYEPSGAVFIDKPVSVEITKVDASSHSKRLSGAVFELYIVNLDGSLSGPIRTGTSDSMGKVIFNSTDESKLELNTVYCIIEKSAPNGYSVDDAPHYFVIVPPKMSDDFSDYNIDNLHIWYDSPEYSITIENSKGTISVEKVFVDENDREYTPTSGKYRFGLFDVDGKLLEILTIEYTKNGQKYYLDDLPKEGPNFSKFEPEGVYWIYELDENGNPIGEGDRTDLNTTLYTVRYSSNKVTVNSTVTITNYIVPVADLPALGGFGTTIFKLCGTVLVLFSMGLMYLNLKRKRSEAENEI